MLEFKHLSKTLIKFKNRISVNSHLTIIIYILDYTIIVYNTTRSAAKYLKLSHTTLLRYINRNKLIKD
jgi:hypothetical protein